MIDFKTKYGKFALVTGSSSGIGEEFARQLAGRGLNLILVARRKDKLKELADDLRSRFGVEIKILELDLLNDTAVNDLLKQTEDLEVGLIVLSAGILTVGTFLNTGLKEQLDVVRLDSLVPMQPAHHFGKKMVERNRGGILFIASVAGHLGMPYQANYAASKAYILSLGQALHFELEGKGVDVTVLSPGLTKTEGVQNTKGVDFKKLGMPMMEPKTVAEAGLNALGKKPVVIPGALNNFSDFLTKHLFPRAFGIKLMGKLVSGTLDSSFEK